MNADALFSISYGLFVLTARQAGRDNGCVVNTVQQVTHSPLRLTAAVSKDSLTHHMILHTGVFNVSVLNRDAPFAVFQHYGFQSGRATDKIVGEPIRAANGLVYLPAVSNAYFSCQVVQTVDLDTHSLFLADVTEAEVLNDIPSMTYADYHAYVKPKPQNAQSGWRCKVCGYVYEGEALPPDFICPLCRHGAEDFEKIR